MVTHFSERICNPRRYTGLILNLCSSSNDIMYSHMDWRTSSIIILLQIQGTETELNSKKMLSYQIIYATGVDIRLYI